MSSLLGRRGASLLLASLLLVACSRADVEAIDNTRVAFPTIGVGRSGDSVILVFPTCEPQLQGLSLYDIGGGQFWNLRSVDGKDRSFDAITLGEVPEGMRATTPYISPPLNRQVMLSTSSAESDGAIKYAEFTLESLPDDALKVGDSRMSVEKFKRRSACEAAS